MTTGAGTGDGLRLERSASYLIPVGGPAPADAVRSAGAGRVMSAAAEPR
ncbi:hypothetical protein [Streptomyces sp. JB150]|nr:hypothetical protein [Streptomyces sp. JB150]QIJ61027.1 hypothetical protein G7Z13_02510 [Streptomyces sp. JB150]